MASKRDIQAAARVNAYLSVLEAVRADAIASLQEPERAHSNYRDLAASRLTVAEIYNRLERTVLQELVDATPVRGLDASRAALEQRAIEAILSGTEWLTGDDVGERYNPDAKNKHAAVSRWLAEGKIFAIERRGQRLFPRYEFDEAWQPLPVVARILQIFEGYSSFRLAGWFESSTARLNGQKPREVVATAPDRVIKAAQEHIAGPLHG